MMKNILIGVLIATSFVLADSAEENNLKKDSNARNGKVFLGPEIGFGDLGTFNAGLNVGYQYFFPKDIKATRPNIRHGIRGYANVSYLLYAHNKIFLNSLYAGGVIDYLLDFNAGNKYNWGLFVGATFGYHNVFKPTKPNNTNITSGLYSGTHIGPSLTINNKHKIELVLGYSKDDNFTIRYLVLF